MTLHDRDAMLDALDRFGANVNAWPDSNLAGSARRMALADRDFRARLESIAFIEAGLGRMRDELDAEVTASGASDRVAKATFARLPARRVGVRRWALAAAAVVVAAALGALADIALLSPPGSASFEVVVLDPLVFDPAGTLLP